MKKLKIFLFNLFIITIIFSLIKCNNNSSTNQQEVNVENQEVNVYTHRQYEIDDVIFKQFTDKTGIKVNILKADADELINRITTEGKNSPADILMTVDAGRLYRAKENGLLQAIQSEILTQNIPEHFRDKDGQWYGLTYRARILVYHKEKVNPNEIPTYESLTQEKFKGKILVRTSENLYNQSLLAAMIATQGKEKAKEWATGIVRNMARDPKGNDRDQMKAIAGGIGEIAIVNSYYLASLINSTDAEEQKVGNMMGINFPNQENRGTHVNISGAGVAKYAPNKENAVKLLEYLTTDSIQSIFAMANYEYPVKKEVETASILESWGNFKIDTVDFAKLGMYNRDAIVIFNEVGWK